MIEPLNITHLITDPQQLITAWKPDASGWLPHGHCVTYRPDGRLHVELTYNQGIPDGPYRDYWLDGRVSTEGQYVHGVQEGEWRFHHRDTDTVEIIKFVAGREIVDWDAFFGRDRATDGGNE